MEQKTFSVEAMTEEEFCKLAQEGRILGIIGKEVEISPVRLKEEFREAVNRTQAYQTIVRIGEGTVRIGAGTFTVDYNIGGNYITVKPYPVPRRGK